MPKGEETDLTTENSSDVSIKAPVPAQAPAPQPEQQPQPPLVIDVIPERPTPVDVEQRAEVEDERPLSELIAATSFLENALQTPFSLALNIPLPPLPVESGVPEIEEPKMAMATTPSSRAESLVSSAASSTMATPSAPSGSQSPIPRVSSCQSQGCGEDSAREIWCPCVGQDDDCGRGGRGSVKEGRGR